MIFFLFSFISEIGEIATGYTKRCIVVSTLKEAEVFADGGFDDIVYGQLFTEDKMSRYRTLISLCISVFQLLGQLNNTVGQRYDTF